MTEPFFNNKIEAALAARSHGLRLPVFWWLVTCFWLVISLASALEISLLQSFNFSEALVITLTRLLPSILLTPLIFWISTVYTLERATWKRAIWVYILACVFYLCVVGAMAYLGPTPPLLRGENLHGTSVMRDARSVMYLILWRATSQLPTFWGLVGVAHALRFYERNNLRELRETELLARLAHARLQALRRQLNPHFLFNTLNSIASLVQENPALAEKMIEALSSLLRLAVNASDRPENTLREELQFLDSYLMIEQTRFGGRLRIEKQIDEAVLDDLVPTLILQPLVENAMKHGIEAQLAPGVVRISVQRTGDRLRLEVADEGAEWRALPPQNIQERVGLGNTRARLREMFGNAASLELRPGRAGGFSVVIQMPCQTKTAGARERPPAAVEMQPC